jgi:hypothetical protein
MIGASLGTLPADLIAELENKYFWWEPVGGQPRSEARVLAQAMDQASFADIRRLETVAGPERLVEIMAQAEPGWFSDRSWELWRGRLSCATGRSIAAQPPRRSFHDSTL